MIQNQNAPREGSRLGRIIQKQNAPREGSRLGSEEFKIKMRPVRGAVWVE